MNIPYNKPFATGEEGRNIANAIERGHISGDGHYTKMCHAWLEQHIGCQRALLTHSCTAALEMAAILADIQPGDEIIMPSYTFVSTANAFVLRGGIPVFVDVRRDTLNLDVDQIESAITPQTKAIVPVHYAGVACEMKEIMAIAEEYRILVIEDAAQGIGSEYEGRPLGSIGHLGALSFHETKNIISGEGGALLLNDARYMQRAEIIREKGTNRSSFFRGEIDKYTWVDIGSSYLPSDMVAAFLWAQLGQSEQILARRRQIWERYHGAFFALEALGKLRRPVIPARCTHNAHLYYLLLPSFESRTTLISQLKEKGIGAIFHYVPLHSSPAGRKYGRVCRPLEATDELSDRIVRLPLWVGMEDEMVDYIVQAVYAALE